MSQTVGTGYLARTEANFVTIRPGPDVVYLKLLRSFAGEGQETHMFAELTPGNAVKLVRELQACIRVAIGRSS